MRITIPRHLLLTALLFLIATNIQAQTITETNGNFNLYSNGIVKCTAASNGETGTLGGITYTRRTKTEIQSNHSIASTSCTSGITSMQNMFQGATTFNEDISSWDVSNVNNFAFFFYKATSFNQDIGEWDVSTSGSIANMFRDATTFNQDISAWDMSNYTNMNNIFNGATAFNQDISAWDVSEATGMNSIFNGAANFNQDLSTWCVPGISSLPLNFGNAGTNPV